MAPTVEPRISLITLAVADLGASRRFYVDGLGWEPFLEGGDVLMIRAGDRLLLSLWTRAGFTAEVGEPMTGGIAPLTLAHNLASAAEVDRVIEAMVAAGGALGEAGTRREWGGYSGYVLDPDGYRWEIADAGDGPITDLVVPSAGDLAAVDAAGSGDGSSVDNATSGDAAADLPAWRRSPDALRARWATGSFAAGVDLVVAIGEVAEAIDHHPDLDLRFDHLDVALSSHDVGGVTDRDLDLAHRISALAAGRGIEPER